jgi:hypothetical protein
MWNIFAIHCTEHGLVLVTNVVLVAYATQFNHRPENSNCTVFRGSNGDK